MDFKFSKEEFSELLLSGAENQIKLMTVKTTVLKVIETSFNALIGLSPKTAIALVEQLSQHIETIQDQEIEVDEARSEALQAMIERCPDVLEFTEEEEDLDVGSIQ